MITKYGADAVLQAFMDDLKIIEQVHCLLILTYITLFSVKDGIVVNGLSFAIRGTVTLASGDNLGSCYIGGYKAPSGALRKCRHCMATSENMSIEVFFMHSRC